MKNKDQTLLEEAYKRVHLLKEEDTTTNTLLNKGEQKTKKTTLKTLEIRFEGKHYYIKIDKEGRVTIEREGRTLCSIDDDENWEGIHSKEIDRVLEYLDSIGEYDLDLY